MKILIIQLARFGDILMTAPVVGAIKRANPDSQVDMLVREKFSMASQLIDDVDSIKVLNSKEWLKPIIHDFKRVNESIEVVDSFVEMMVAEGYDKIINLSFSPLSSYIVDAISNTETQVSGYARHTDGFLAIPDDTSAYFYGQVGVGKANRIHLIDIFAAVAGVDLQNHDFKCVSDLPEVENFISSEAAGSSYICIHVGASEPHKCYPSFKWAQVIRGLTEKLNVPIFLIGSPAERDTAEEIVAVADSIGLMNLVGKTNLLELASVVKNCSVLIGADSMPIQLANLVDTKCLNLSFSSVNFWETGPRVEGSRILFEETPEELGSDTVVKECIGLINSEITGQPVILRNNTELIGYDFINKDIPDDHQWNLVEALYMEAEFPLPQSQVEHIGYQRLQEVCQLALEEIPKILIPEQREMASDVLSQVDQILLSMEKMVPALTPLFSWFQTERLRLGPGDLEDIVKSTEDIFSRLYLVTQLFVEPELKVASSDSVESDGENFEIRGV